MEFLKLAKERKDKRPMNEAKTKYNKKCKSRIITFYLHEGDLYEFSKKINFQKEVKGFLKRFKRFAEKYGKYENEGGDK